MNIAVASGKGGTGKTTVAVNLALSLENVQLLDCDVEEPNVHIFLNPQVNGVRNVYIPVPKVDEKLCDYCGKCSEFCEFHAIAVIAKKILVFPKLCHGCGGCFLVCPKGTISEKKRKIGVVKKGTAAKNIEIVYGELNVGEPMSKPVIREVRREKDPGKITIIDAPPGTACPVIASVYGSDYCILVTDPTPFGLHDLKLMVDVLRKISIPLGIVVNRSGIGDEKLYEYCEKEKIPILLEIPFKRRIAELYSRGIPFITEMPEWKSRFLALFENIRMYEGR
ncbi:ATP-binding protein [Candidatus Hecatella orcuttiae]|jgi:MinD superfamily P-loop ATPase|uniref:ATP-binding protein n=1 Tax=Candidatus Hecatella orcuttiae TaxID=1935119 RepID=UPI00286813BE|nr:ATP-binding protein [Candidatus Hecatella orcuttiae]